ncbi:OmpW/AlkL family protein [Acinetobacter sp. MD2]|uniref:OmpW/AlkL family protein n=1 Tax=Acinetobacter sp. MD2 TaxID=2600066 RepID=UPI002D1EC250|nr:OmpW family outer membrane protein [Acinetobacter sp. MD2]MEB3766180.1 OmpW family protein [Acinetobacter sp. MD2]
MNQVIKAVLPAALLAISAVSHAETSDGKTVAVSTGWAHIMPQGKAQGVATKGLPFNSTSGFELEDADTAELKLDYLVDDNVSLGLILGAPPKLDIQGKGSLLKGILPNGLDINKKVGDVKVYSPVLTGKYTFGPVNSRLRPYIGAGLMYAHFSNFKLDSSVENDPTLQALHGTIQNVKIDDTIAPVAFVGADYNINSNWFATASVSYVHLSTHAKLDVVTPQGTLTGSSKIEINPIVTYLGLGYRF